MQQITNCSRYSFDPKTNTVVTKSTGNARPFKTISGRQYIHLTDDKGRFRMVPRDAIVNNSVPAMPNVRRGRPTKRNKTKVRPTSTPVANNDETIALPLSVCKDVVSGKISMAEMHAYLALKCSPDTVSVKKITQSTLSKLIKKNLITVV